MNSINGKTELIGRIYWDYDVDPKTILGKIEGSVESSPKELTRIFVRCFERLHWYDLVDIWGTEKCLEMLNEDTGSMIRPQLRERYETICSILHGKPVSFSKQGLKNRLGNLRPYLTRKWLLVEPVPPGSSILG